MKYFTLLMFFLASSFLCLGQEPWRQKNARINFVVSPQGEFSKVAAGYTALASVSAAISFNNTWFAGIYAAKKVLPGFTEYPIAPGVNYDANFQHAGAEGTYSLNLGLYRTKGGHYVMRKTRLDFGLRVGVGMMWMDTEAQRLATRTDYFSYVQPRVGASYPINPFLKVCGGLYFSALIKLNVLDQFFDPNDFMGPGAYIGVKANVFRNY